MKRIIPGTNYAVDSPLGEVIDVVLPRQKVVQLTDAQYKALQQSPVTLIEATETLNYDPVLVPKTIPIPRECYITFLIDDASKAYDNMDASYRMALAHGSDISQTLVTIDRGAVNGGIFGFGQSNGGSLTTKFPHTAVDSTDLSGYLSQQCYFLSNAMLDNALIIYSINGGSDLTGGDDSNKIFVTLFYNLLDTSTGRLS
jgi:hypothetical protein